MHNDIVVYTAIFNKYDTLKKIKKNKNYDLICFTDDPHLTSDIYTIKLVKRKFSDPTRDARMYKILPHKFLSEYKYSMWLDASMLTKKGFDPEKMISEHLQNTSFTTFKHPGRNCVYDEFTACIDLQIDDTKLMHAQQKKYLEENYPRKNGLIWSGCIMRKHNKKEIIRFDEMWWKELCNFSRRDQLSFNYIAYKTRLLYTTLDINMYDNNYFFYVGHKSLKRKCDALIQYIETFFKKHINFNIKKITKK